MRNGPLPSINICTIQECLSHRILVAANTEVKQSPLNKTALGNTVAILQRYYCNFISIHFILCVSFCLKCVFSSRRLRFSQPRILTYERKLAAYFSWQDLLLGNLHFILISSLSAHKGTWKSNSHVRSFSFSNLCFILSS